MRECASVRHPAPQRMLKACVAALFGIAMAFLWAVRVHADQPTAAPGAPAATAPAPCLKLTTLQVMQLMNAWRAGLASGDAEKMASFYTDNATLVATTDGKPVTGREAIRAYYAELLPRHPQPRFISNTIAVDCNSATVQGVVLYRITGERKGTRMLLGGRYKVEFAFQKNFWQITKQSLAANPRKSGEPIASL